MSSPGGVKLLLLRYLTINIGPLNLYAFINFKNQPGKLIECHLNQLWRNSTKGPSVAKLCTLRLRSSKNDRLLCSFDYFYQLL